MIETVWWERSDWPSASRFHACEWGHLSPSSPSWVTGWWSLPAMKCEHRQDQKNFLSIRDVWLCTQEGTLRLKQPVEWMPSPSPSSWAQLRRILLTFLEWWLGSLALGSRSHLKVLSVSGWLRPLLPAKEGFLLCPYLKQYWQQWLEWE